MRSRWAAIDLLAAVLLLWGCGGNGKTPPNPTPFISGLFPPSIGAGSPNFTLFIAGTGFIASSQAFWNGSQRTTTLNVNTNQLAVSIFAQDVANPGMAQITVVNPAPGGGTSSAKTFVINQAPNPPPSITSLSPPSAVAGGPAFCLTVNGSGFISSSQVAWNGSPRQPSANCSGATATALTVQINAADIANPGSAKVTVTNPAPGGGTSAPATFTITSPAASRKFPQIVSVNVVGGAAGGPSRAPAISADGRFVAFYSQAKNLVALGASGNVFLRDTCMGAGNCSPRTIAVDLAPGGGAPNGFASPGLTLSADGRFLAFASTASNLVPGLETAKRMTVYVRDLCIGKDSPAGCTPHTDVVSSADGGEPANGSSSSPSISADGRFIAFLSGALNLVAGISGSNTRIFVRDTCAGPSAAKDCVPRTMAVPLDGQDGSGGIDTLNPAISGDGRFVAFEISNFSTLPPGGKLQMQVLLADICLGRAAPAACSPSTTGISVAPDGAPGDGPSFSPALSKDGRFIVFASVASNLAPGAALGSPQIFLRDTCLGQTAPDGCVPATTLISEIAAAIPGNPQSFSPAISSSGRYITFVVGGPNGVGGLDAATTGQLFIRDTCFGAENPCTPVTVPIDAPGGGLQISPVAVNLFTRVPITEDGRMVAFHATASDLSTPSSGFGDVFLTVTPF
jgi:Tol biopolymer transport system component